MIFLRALPKSRTGILLWLLLLIGLPQTCCHASASSFPAGHSTAATKAEGKNHATIPAFLISDVHFDPFHDPAKASRLVSAPISEWPAILSAPPSPDQQQAFAQLQQTCHAHGVDTPYPLLRSSLLAMQSRLPDPKFMTVSGDLIAHEFTCRYSTLFPDSTPADYHKFVLKTIGFVLAQLRARFPGVPIYAALGNNDTPCNDYHLDPESKFLADTGRIIARGLPASDRQRAIREFSNDGSYSIMMAAPMRHTRLIVLDDVFLSSEYKTCAGGADQSAADAEMMWLRNQLSQARRQHQRVWVMGHIPTGIDPYATLKYRDVCAHQAPVQFLSSPELADLLIEYADVIRLAIFAHTHMDEIRLLEPRTNRRASLKHMVAIKMVPSISPVDGNDPSFTIAYVDPASAVLRDYEVIAASNHTGIATTWSREYDFRHTYHQAQFTPGTVKALINGFAADSGGNTQASRHYMRYYFIGDRSPELKPFWPEYVCALTNTGVRGYTACACTTPPPQH